MRFIRVSVPALVALTSSSALSAAETVTYTYDAQGRLVQVVHSGGPANGTQTTYTQDAAGNRTNVQTTGASH